LKGFPEEIGIGEGVIEYRLQLSTVVGIHDDDIKVVEKEVKVEVGGGRLITIKGGLEGRAVETSGMKRMEE
jgi:hypothetical protein